MSWELEEKGDTELWGPENYHLPRTVMGLKEDKKDSDSSSCDG